MSNYFSVKLIIECLQHLSNERGFAGSVHSTTRHGAAPKRRPGEVITPDTSHMMPLDGFSLLLTTSDNYYYKLELYCKSMDN